MPEKGRRKPASALQSDRHYKGQIMLLRLIIFLALKLGRRRVLSTIWTVLVVYIFCSSRKAFSPSIIPHYLICSYCQFSVSSKQSWQNFYRNVMFTSLHKKWWFMLFHSATETEFDALFWILVLWRLIWGSRKRFELKNYSFQW